MNVEKFKAEHPDIYGAIVAEERDRVTTLIRFGQKFHARELAEKAIAEGTSATDPQLQEAFFQRALAWRYQQDRQEESDAAAEVTRGVEVTPSTGTSGDLGDRMADAMGLPPDRAEVPRSRFVP